jgi:hypothetical protein
MKDGKGVNLDKADLPGKIVNSGSGKVVAAVTEYFRAAGREKAGLFEQRWKEIETDAEQLSRKAGISHL